MPTYDYECQACHHRFERFQSMTAKVLRKCPECGKAKYRKQLSAAGFQLKGTGWYATDFKGGSGGAAAKSSETKSDAQPAAKPESKPKKD